MIKRALYMLFVMCLLCVPAAAERDGSDLLYRLTEKLMDMVYPKKQLDPYLWIYEQETTDATIDDLPEVANTLRGLGINDVTDRMKDGYCQMTEEVIQLMSQHGNGYSVSREQMILGLLFAAGSEQTDGNRCVYAFDAEVYDVENMYRDFLMGIERIGNGELRFETSKKISRG